MSHGFEPIPAIAGGTIRVCRFVKASTAADATLLEADANEEAVGVSQEGPKAAPVDGADSDDIAVATDPIAYFPEGSVCLLEIGSGGCTRGANLKSDADGKGVLAATTGATMQWVGAKALETASEGELAKVLVKVYPIYPALA
jgi:hypothetical protein